MKKIIVGSASLHKMEAIREALSQLGVKAVVFGVKTESGVNEQPVGLGEIFSGAMRRAQEAYDRRWYASVGIENGILREHNITIDLAVIVVISTEHRRYYVATSSGIEFPNTVVKEAEGRGFEKHTVGEVIAEKIGGDKTDPHLTLTHQRISRKETLVQGVKLAFAQIPNLEEL